MNTFFASTKQGVAPNLGGNDFLHDTAGDTGRAEISALLVTPTVL
jgi:hypothetical protein